MRRPSPELDDEELDELDEEEDDELDEEELDDEELDEDELFDEEELLLDEPSVPPHAESTRLNPVIPSTFKQFDEDLFSEKFGNMV